MSLDLIQYNIRRDISSGHGNVLTPMEVDEQPNDYEAGHLTENGQAEIPPDGGYAPAHQIPDEPSEANTHGPDQGLQSQHPGEHLTRGKRVQCENSNHVEADNADLENSTGNDDPHIVAPEDASHLCERGPREQRQHVHLVEHRHLEPDLASQDPGHADDCDGAHAEIEHAEEAQRVLPVEGVDGGRDQRHGEAVHSTDRDQCVPCPATDHPFSARPSALCVQQLKDYCAFWPPCCSNNGEAEYVLCIGLAADCLGTNLA